MKSFEERWKEMTPEEREEVREAVEKFAVGLQRWYESVLEELSPFLEEFAQVMIELWNRSLPVVFLRKMEELKAIDHRDENELLGGR